MLLNNNDKHAFKNEASVSLNLASHKNAPLIGWLSRARISSQYLTLVFSIAIERSYPL
jgi:hypothetical protein